MWKRQLRYGILNLLSLKPFLNRSLRKSSGKLNFPKQRPPGDMAIGRKWRDSTRSRFPAIFLCTVLKKALFLLQCWSICVETKRLWRIVSEIKINCPFFFASLNRMSFCLTTNHTKYAVHHATPYYEAKWKANISNIYRITMSNSINLNCHGRTKHPLYAFQRRASMNNSISAVLWIETTLRLSLSTYSGDLLGLRTTDWTSLVTINVFNAVFVD